MPETCQKCNFRCDSLDQLKKHEKLKECKDWQETRFWFNMTEEINRCSKSRRKNRGSLLELPRDSSRFLTLITFSRTIFSTHFRSVGQYFLNTVLLDINKCINLYIMKIFIEEIHHIIIGILSSQVIFIFVKIERDNRRDEEETISPSVRKRERRQSNIKMSSLMPSKCDNTGSENNSDSLAINMIPNVPPASNAGSNRKSYAENSSNGEVDSSMNNSQDDLPLDEILGSRNSETFDLLKTSKASSIHDLTGPDQPLATAVLNKIKDEKPRVLAAFRQAMKVNYDKFDPQKISIAPELNVDGIDKADVVKECYKKTILYRLL